MLGIKVNYYVRNSYNAIIGGYKTLEQAENALNRFETEARNNPFDSGVTYHITKA